MTAPTKFCMGDIPHTSTGLVPSTYRNTMDSLAKQWSTLPKRPPPEMFPYRGDYVNARNRRLQAKKKARKIPPHQKKPPNVVPAVIVGPEWDPYCQHISSTKLSADEQDAKTKNKEHFTAFVRSEAAKRERRLALERKLRVELGEKENKHITQCPPSGANKPRKPPVPRLSYMARTGKKPRSALTKVKESNSIHAKHDEGNKPRHSKEEKPKRSYLEFLSRKLEKQESFPAKSTERKGPTPKMKVSSQEPTDSRAYDEFRVKVETIVQKAAAMVIEQQKDHILENIPHQHHHDLDSKATELHSDVSREHETRSKCVTQRTEHSELSDAYERLLELEDRIRCLSRSSSSCSSSSSSSSSSLAQNASPRDRYQRSMDLQACPGTHIKEHSTSNDSCTEVIPRHPVEPTKWSNVSTSNVDGESVLSCGSEQPVPLNIQPSARPVQPERGEEPVPRGHDAHYRRRTHQDMDVAQEILSLL